MNFNTSQFNAVVADARAKAAGQVRWLRAIDRAAAALVAGELIVTTLVDGALVTSPNGTYRANGSCECKAAMNGHRECWHRAAAKLVENYELMTPPRPRIVRSVEQDQSGRRYVVIRCDGWMV